MCGRYAQTKARKKLEEAFAAFFLGDELDFTPRYNIAPTQSALVVVREDQRIIKRMVWGLIPSWAKDATIASQLTVLNDAGGFDMAETIREIEEEMIQAANNLEFERRCSAIKLRN